MEYEQGIPSIHDLIRVPVVILPTIVFPVAEALPKMQMPHMPEESVTSSKIDKTISYWETDGHCRLHHFERRY